MLRLPLPLPPPHEVSALRKGSFEFEKRREQNKNKGERREGRWREMKEIERKVINIDDIVARERKRIKYNKKSYKLATVTSYM